MDARDIKKEIYRRGYTIGMIADAIGKSPSLVSKVINSKARSFFVANKIAICIESEVNIVFPEVYETTFPLRDKTSLQYKNKIDELKMLLSMS